MDSIKLQIITPQKVLYDGDVTMIEYNTTEGYVGVLPGHIPMTQVLASGKFAIYETKNEEPKVGALHAGFVQIMPDLITILAEIVEWKEDIDVERAKLSADRAKKRISEHPENLDVARAEVALKKALTRIEVAS